MGGLLIAALGATAVRAVSLQVIQRARLSSMATDQSVREMEIPARRGDIYDRRGIPLAQSVAVDSLWLDPSMVADLHRAARDLARTLRLDAAELEGRLTRARRFAWVKRQVTPQEVTAAQRLEIPGLGVAKEPKRFYPQRELGAQVLGVVGTDGHGLEGLELAFEDELSGQSEKVEGTRDARGRNLLLQGAPEAVGRQGATVTLTLDRQVQYVAEKALDRAGGREQGHRGNARGARPADRRAAGARPVAALQPQRARHRASPRARSRDRPALDLVRAGAAPTRPSSPPRRWTERIVRPRGHLRLRGRQLGGRPARHPRHPPARDADLGRILTSPRTSARPRSRSGSGARG
jgi:cell division protein FtsI (penicillin-binding protein 3)